jgi:hypothetical protein
MTNSPTMPPPPVAPPTGGASVAANVKAPSLRKLTDSALPPRIVVNGVEGWGKTSMAAYANIPAIIMARGETGYQTLLGAGLVPSVDTAVVNNWGEYIALLTELADQDAMPYKTIVTDAMGGAERLCHEHVCATEFHGEWGEKGFMAYQRGYDVAVTDWLAMLQLLDRIHAKGVMILMLSHCQVKTTKNPMGADYDRYVSNVHSKTWGVTHKWADMVLFAKFHTVVNADGKGIGGNQRMIYTEHRDAYDAKNRYGMAPEIVIPDDPARVWDVIRGSMKQKKAGVK